MFSHCLFAMKGKVKVAISIHRLSSIGLGRDPSLRAVSLHVMVVINLVTVFHYFLLDPWLPSQPHYIIYIFIMKIVHKVHAQF